MGWREWGQEVGVGDRIPQLRSTLCSNKSVVTNSRVKGKWIEAAAVGASEEGRAFSSAAWTIVLSVYPNNLWWCWKLGHIGVCSATYLKTEGLKITKQKPTWEGRCGTENAKLLEHVPGVWEEAEQTRATACGVQHTLDHTSSQPTFSPELKWGMRIWKTPPYTCTVSPTGPVIKEGSLM